jgi:type IV secretion system protein VirB1
MVTVAVALAACGLTGAPAALLERIVAVESAGSVLAINVNGDSELVRQPRDLREAVAMARWLLEHGYNFDAGIAQINSTNFERLGLTVEGLFDACTSLRAGLQVFSECRARAVARFGEGPQAEAAAVSCYNTGDLSRGLRNGYVAAVLGAAGQGGRGAPRMGEARKTTQTEAGTGSDLEGLQRVADVFGAGPGR